VEDLDREVLAYLAEDVLLLLLDHLAGPVMGVDHVIADLEVDVLDLALDLEVLDVDGCLGNRVSSFFRVRLPDRTTVSNQVCR
jgi:hypothetical protein